MGKKKLEQPGRAFAVRLANWYAVPVSEFLRRWSREEIIELMAYDDRFGLPDLKGQSCPSAPLRPEHEQTAAEQIALVSQTVKGI